MTRSGSGCSLSPRATAVIAGLLAGRGACYLSAPETMARTAATAACRLGASAVTTLMMVPAVCALAMLADLHHAAWLAAAA